MNRIISERMLREFRDHLSDLERAPATIQKYLRDIRTFTQYQGNNPVTKKSLAAYKEHLQASYKPASVNSMLSALNHFLDWCGWDIHIRALKIQRQVFREENLELTKEEYLRLLETAKNGMSVYGFCSRLSAPRASGSLS